MDGMVWYACGCGRRFDTDRNAAELHWRSAERRLRHSLLYRLSTWLTLRLGNVSNRAWRKAHAYSA